MARHLQHLALLLVCFLAQTAGVAAFEIRVLDPRDYGHFLGDQITREITVFPNRKGEVLNTAALPQPGPLTYWLDLVHVTTEDVSRQSKKGTKISLTYQIFYAALEPKSMTIPGFQLFAHKSENADPSSDEGRDDKPDTTTPARVPELNVIVSPLREIMPPQNADPKDPMPLKADVPARTIGTGTLRTSLLALAATWFCGVLALAHYYAVPPFHKRAARPFARAERAIRTLSTNEPEAQTKALRLLHRAFDDANGGRLLRSDIERFLDTRAHLRPLTDRIENFFAASADRFFGSAENTDYSPMSLQELVSMGRDLARAERAAS